MPLANMPTKTPVKLKLAFFGAVKVSVETGRMGLVKSVATKVAGAVCKKRIAIIMEASR